MDVATKNSEFSTNFWHNNIKDGDVLVHCMISNYEVVKLMLPVCTTFKQLKVHAFSHVCKTLKEYPGNNFEEHLILYVSEDTCYQEIQNYDLMLMDVDFFIPVFRFLDSDKLDSPGTGLTQLLNRYDIDLEMESDFCKEVQSQRIKLNMFAFNEHETLQKSSFQNRFVKKYPQLVRKVDSLSAKHQTMIVNKKKLKIKFALDYSEDKKISFDLEVPIASNISTLKSTIYDKLKTEHGISIEKEHTLKLAGRQVFLTGILTSETGIFDEDTRFIDYMEIQNKIMNDDEIFLTIADLQNEFMKLEEAMHYPFDDYNKKKEKIDRVNIWNLEKTEKLGFLIKSLEVDPINFFMLKIGLFYGDRLLEKVIETKVYLSANPNIEEEIKFEIPLFLLPINSKICIVVYGSKNKSSNEPKPKYMNPIAWVNLNICDFNGYIDETTKINYLFTNPISKMNNGLYPLGTTIPLINDKTNFKITYRFNVGGKILFYPMEKQMKSTLSKTDLSKSFKKTKELSDEIFFKEMSEWLTFHELNVDEKDKLWHERNCCLKKYPNLVPKILQSMPDFSKNSVCKVFLFLKKAPLLNQELCLELFQIKYCHPLFRTYLVKNLEEFSDEKLELYMTQIVEGLKIEQHIYNDLTLFLLKRSIHNRRIAHYFLWNLLADNHNIEVCVRNAIIVEAYCKVRPDHLEDILKQVDLMNKLKMFYEFAGLNNFTDTISLLVLFKRWISCEGNYNVFKDMSCPLDPSFYLKELVLDDCKVMESKKKPILLVFRTDDSFSPKVRILYKYGDDLRQDLLVLTCLKIVNNLCQSVDPEIKFTCYNVLHAGHMEGMIQLVEDATTLGNIQAKRGFKPQILHEWFKDKLEDEKKLNEEELRLGCTRFASTCAGYSVMTYIMGIGDRHNDNIMIHKSGRLFHIDFGHILGNFKNFYGIKRERAPFIMTKDFLYFATNEQLAKNDIKKYRDYCADLFVRIRESSYLIFYPFLLMANAGLPELNSEKDIFYIASAIDFSLDPTEAKQKFEEKFNEAFEKSWSTELNFKAHNMRVAGSSKSKNPASHIIDLPFPE